MTEVDRILDEFHELVASAAERTVRRLVAEGLRHRRRVHEQHRTDAERVGQRTDRQRVRDGLAVDPAVPVPGRPTPARHVIRFAAGLTAYGKCATIGPAYASTHLSDT